MNKLKIYKYSRLMNFIQKHNICLVFFSIIQFCTIETALTSNRSISHVNDYINDCTAY